MNLTAHAFLLSAILCPWLFGQERTLIDFQRKQLADDYYSEGISAGDLNGDGHMDVVYGPFWFAGPDFRERKIIYPSLPQPREAYASHFFAWIKDIDRDGLNDVLTVGFPGTAAYVYQNPGKDGWGTHWPKHEVFDWVSNESPHFTQLVGDARPELVCTRDGYFGYASMDPAKPLSPWTFHKISKQVAHKRFGHGLGVGDVNDDGRADVLMNAGWFEQPASLNDEQLWLFHEAVFAPSGGAEMHVYDVDGDGDNDVITSLAAHEYGLSWFEQTGADSDEIAFKEHLIMGDRPALNRYGVHFSELHSVNIADMDGDGLKDIVTGKTYWSHHKKSPGWDDGAVVYWFKLVRDADGVDWIPMEADGKSGIGRQIGVIDLNKDTFPDIITGGMKGAHVLLQKRQSVDESIWKAAQPKPVKASFTPPERGSKAPIDKETGKVPNALEGESLKFEVTEGKGVPQNMSGFAGSQWSAGSQLFWQGGNDGDSLSIKMNSPQEGSYTLEAVFTSAPDYGIIQLALDDKPLGKPIDLYQFAKVTSTGVLSRPLPDLKPGDHTLKITIVGANANAVQNKFVGLDYLRLTEAN